MSETHDKPEADRREGFGVHHQGDWEVNLRIVLSVVLIPTVALLLGAITCSAQEGGIATAPSLTADKSAWAYSITPSYNSPRNQNDFVSAVMSAEKGPLHLEARYNYEALYSGSLFVGWKFSGGEKITYELTPIIGAVFGQKEGIAPGFEAAAAYSVVDLYTEAEYVYDVKARQGSFTYDWSELGFTLVDWLRFGFVVQRTKIYRNDRGIQRGLFAQIIYRKATFTVDVLNPDDNENQIWIFGIGAKF